MVTVERDPSHVEFRLSAGKIRCPSCSCGVLGGWGHARSRTIVGAGPPIRPRRARCRGCGTTHVLLPVTLLSRRAYLAEWIWAALVAKARGRGHRGIAADLEVPESTVRGWLRVMGGRLESVRTWFLRVAVGVGVDPTISKATGSRFADALGAVAAAADAMVSRFGPVGLFGAVTASSVAVASSSGRLLAPGWPPAAGPGQATPVDPAVIGPVL